jgi:hypothetical protein
MPEMGMIGGKEKWPRLGTDSERKGGVGRRRVERKRREEFVRYIPRIETEFNPV